MLLHVCICDTVLQIKVGLAYAVFTVDIAASKITRYP